MNQSNSIYTQEVEELRNENAQLKQKIDELTSERIAEKEILKESEQRYLSLFNNSTLGIAHLKLITNKDIPVDFEFINVNEAFTRITGLLNKEVIGKRASKILSGLENSPHDYINKFAKVALEGDELNFEAYSDIFKIWLSYYVYSPKKGEFTIIFSDITERKIIEQEANEKAMEIEAILNCIADGVVVYDKQGRITRANSAAELILKLRDTDKNLTLTERLPKKYKVTTEDGYQLSPEEMPAYRAAVLGETSMNNLLFIETENQGKWVNLSAAPLIVNGKHNGGIISLSDVTSRKVAEEKFRESEERLRLLADNISQIVWIANTQGEVLWFNKRWYDYTGLTPEQSKSRGKITHPEHAERVLKSYYHSLSSGNEWEDIYPMLGKDGEYRWFLGRALPIKNEKGQVTLWFGSNTDITELKNAQEALELNEQRTKAIFEHAAIGICEVDHNDKFIRVNNKLCEIIGYSRQELLGKKVGDVINEITSPEDLARSLEMKEKLLKGEIESIDIEKKYLKHDGSYIWVHITVSTVHSHNEHWTIRTLEDITSRKKAEDELRKEEQRLQAMFNNAAIGIVEVDSADKIIAVNTRLCEILEYKPEDLIGISISQLTYEEDRELSDTMNSKLHNGELKMFDYEKRYKKGNGTPLWVYVTVSGILNSEGVHINSIGTVEDISKRKQFEEALRKSEESLRLIIEAAELGTWDFDINTGIAEHSFRHDQIFGYSEPQKEWSYEISIKHMLPEFESVVREAYDRAIKTGILNYEAKVKWPDGSIHWIAPHGRVQYSPEGKPLRMAGIVSDITERKMAEEAVKESEETFSKMFHALPIGVSLASYPDEKLTNVNRAWLNLAEYSDVNEIIDKTKVELGVISEQDMERINAEFNQYGNVRNAETIFQSKTGLQHVININKDVIHIGGKKFVLSTNEDITNQKKYEQEIKQKNEELTRFIYTVSHDLKSPLVTIKSFTAYLKEDIESNDKEAQDKDLGYIENAADKMGRLLDELLELSRIGRKEEPKTEISLETVAKMAIDLVAGRISQKKVKISFSGPPVMLFGFTQRFIQLFQNLIDNAVKFMGDQPEPVIEIGAYNDREKNDIVIFVRDNGSGIDPRYHHKIFGLFEKMDNKTEGSGIGLALVKRIVEVHEGSIWFDSKGVGKGTTFYFTLNRTRLIN